MQVLVNVMVYRLGDYSDSTTALTAFFTMVHMDYDGKPKAVVKLNPVTKEEKFLYSLGEYKYRAIRGK